MTATEKAISRLKLCTSSGCGSPAEADLNLILAAHDRYEKALRDVHEGATRQLAEPRNHDNDQYALTAIATRVEEALCE